MKLGNTRSIALAVAAILTLTGGITIAKPALEVYVTPLVQEQLNTAVNGIVTYDSLRLDWRGQVHIDNARIQDAKKQEIMSVKDIQVALSPSMIIDIIQGKKTMTALISTVTISDGDLQIWQEKDSSWNVTHIIRSNDEDTSSDFRGRILFDTMHVHIKPLQGHAYDVTNVSGGVDLSNMPIIDGAVKATLDNKPITVRGTITMNDAKDFDISIKGDSIHSTYVNDFIGDTIPLSVKRGSLDDIAVHAVRTNKNLKLYGSVVLNDVDAVYDTTYRIHDVHAHVRLDDQKIILSDTKGSINDQAIGLDGVITLQDTANSALNLNVYTTHFDVAQFVDTPIHGLVDGMLHIGGTTVSPTVDGHITSDSIQYEGIGLDRLSADVMYDNHVLKVINGQASIGNGLVEADATYHTDTSEFSVAAVGKSLDLSKLQDITGYDVTGIVNGHVMVTGRDGQLTYINGTLHGDDISYDSFTFDTVDARFEGSPNAYTLTYLNGTIDNGAITGYGTWNYGEAHMNFTGHNLPLSIASKMTGHQLAGTGTITGTWTGTVDNPSIQAKLSANDIGVDQTRYERAKLDLFVKDHVLHVEKGDLLDATGSHSVTGTIGLTGTQSIDMRLDTDNVRIENLISLFTDIPMTGWLSMHNHITGTLRAPKVDGYAHMWEGSLYGKLITDARTTYGYEQGKITVYDGTIDAYGSKIFVDGIASKDKLHINLLGDAIDIGRFLPRTSVDVDGKIAIEGTVSGTMEKPIFEGTVKSRSLMIENTALSNMVGQIHVDPTVVHVEDISFGDETTGYYHATGGMTLGDAIEQNHILGKATVQNGNISRIASMVGQPLERVGGKLSGTIDVDGTVENPSLTVWGTVDHVTFGDRLVGNATIDVGLSNHICKIKKLSLPIGKGMLAVGGQADLRGESNLQIAMKDVDAAYVAPLLSQSPLDLTGTISMITNITGQTKNPHMEFSGEIQNASYQQIGIDRAYALATMENKVIHVNQMVLQKGPYKVKAYGKVPLHALYTSEYLSPGDAEGIDMTLDMNDADLAVLPLSSSLFTKGNGKLKGTLHVTGSYEQPEVNGSLSITNGSLHIKNVANDLANINANLVCKGRTGDFQMEGTMGKGNMGATGHIDWMGRTLTAYTGGIQLDKLDVVNEYIKGPLNGELYITKTDDGPIVKGDINLEHTTIKVPLTLTSDTATSNIALDVSVHAGDKVRLYDPVLYDMLVTGDVHFGGTLVEPHSDGQFTVKRGSVKYLNNRFTINKGMANFGNNSLLPHLYMEASTERSNYQIFMKVDGTVDALKMNLSAKPTLTQNQIVSLLTFGHDRGITRGVGRDDADSLLSEGLQMFAFGYVENTVRDITGLDTFSITNGAMGFQKEDDKDVAGFYNLEIGKYIIPNVYLKYSRGINNDNYSYSIQYDVSKHFAISAWTNSDKNRFVGMKWSKEF